MSENYLQDIKHRLEKTASKEHLKNALRGLSLTIIFSSVLILLISLVESFFNLGTGVRFYFFYLSLFTVLIFSIWFFFIPLTKSFGVFSRINYFSVAEKVGTHFKELKDDLLNSLQLVTTGQTYYSPQLVNAAFERIYKKSKDYNFCSIVNFRQAKKYLRLSMIILALIVLTFNFIPELSSATNRIIDYNTSYIPPQKFYFEITPGNKELTKGDNIHISVKTIGYSPSRISLYTKAVEQTEYVEKKIIAEEAGIFSYEFTSVNNSFDYYAFAEGIESESYKITVINRPIITGFEVNISPPAYSKLPEITLKDNGNISTLPGSKVKLELYSSRQLNNAVIEFNDSIEKKMTINNTKASTEFDIKNEVNYLMLIEDIQGYTNVNPISYSIKLMIDENPSIEMISPNTNIKLSMDGKIPLVSKIKDDYGFSKLNLNYRLTESKYRNIDEDYTVIPLTINKELKEDDIYYVWDLIPLVLAEGEVLTYYLEVFDNDIINGPKSARTQSFTIHVPSMNEMFASAEETQNDALKDLEKTFKEAEKLSKELQKISDDLKQNRREITWQEKERIESSSKKLEDMMQKVEEVSQNLAEMQQDLMQNNLLSQETLDKYNELQNLLDEFNSEELREAFKRLQESMQNMMRDKVQMSLEELKANEEYFKKSLERTLNLLKRVQVEQKLDELIKRTEDISQKIEELKSKTDLAQQSDKNKFDEMSRKQNDISSDMQRLNEEMNKLMDKMNELSDMPKQAMEKLFSEFEKQENTQLSEEAANLLREMKKLQALQKQQNISQNMQSMSKQLQDLKSQMQQMNQLQAYFDMMKILDDLITLSKMQEELKNNTNNLSFNSPELNETAREQNRLQNNLSRILQKMNSLSQKTFAITPEMGRALGKAATEMQNSTNALQNNTGNIVSQRQTAAMKNLNEAASMMKNSMDQMMNGGGQGGGMMSMMQQLQQLSQQQMELNQLTQMLNQGQMTQEMAAQMQRLAQQQEIIRKSIEEMNRESQEAGKSKSLAANLERIMEEMREVVTNLQTEKVNDELIKKQERILSRLLDAQRSINERDFEKERKSNTGRNITRTSPPELYLSSEEGKNKLRDELRKAISEGYKKDYEDLIRKYFEALEKENK